ncbi:MAG: ABC transporter, ATP-binding protein [Osedax symbiont Rs1]|nr:MAG: ABC transporter, ATP-binding protein [Osedax symbiont Rs1]
MSRQQVEPASSSYRLQLQGITKQYPGCLANDKIDLAIQAGEIHALLGENGAGKSTLMKMIYGVTKPDAGKIIWQGTPVTIKDPSMARRMGIGMVFQHFSLFETLTVTENIALALGDEAGDLKQLATRISIVSKQYGMELHPNRHIHSLSVGERQRVEIVRCLVQNIKLLILDEPTSVLTPQEVESLFVTLRQLAKDGCSILFISHKLKEVQALCHSATILRAGKVTGDCIPAEVGTTRMAQLMVGDDTPISTDYPKSSGTLPFLIVKDLSLVSEDPFAATLKNINFEVRSGEILGIAGVAGNGQEELLAALSGEHLVARAEQVCFADTAVGLLDPRARRELGLGFVPEERLGRGAVPEMSLKENTLLTGYLQGLVNNGFINQLKTSQFADQIIKDYKVKTPGNQAAAQSLSGGNLQKFIIGREILQNPKLLVAAHPTWGVDIGAATAIHRALIALRDQGAAILVVSEDIDELFLISDRLCAICDGELSPTKATTATSIEEVGRWMTGVFDQPPVASEHALQTSAI